MRKKKNAQEILRLTHHPSDPPIEVTETKTKIDEAATSIDPLTAHTVTEVEAESIAIVGNDPDHHLKQSTKTRK